MHSTIRVSPASSSFIPDSFRRWLRSLLCLGLALAVAGCGFQLKGTSPLPFETLYTNIPDSSEFGAQLRRAILAASPDTRFVSDPQDAQAKLVQLANRQFQRELSIDAQGQVEEYELNLEFVFQLTDDKNRLLLPPTTLRSTRDMPYDPNSVQAKQGEIATVYRNMRRGLIDRIVRRLTSPEVTEAYLDRDAQPIDENPPEMPPTPSSSQELDLQEIEP
ncbi:LPS assembly lipoprotein LptE [Paracandidimonas soli]|uniref:LPS-assembly lipoprotein LptE n=1 Tax=Paracandidimonas soli TaxID=1917182 RepID=A0A4V2VS72_9BURK|nr:LPS assembly lipoprotein LptE [Paracandidimonas soli]TCV01300.1 LPS-assembly lipoprotein [Paracandidimonas soli]